MQLYPKIVTDALESVTYAGTKAGIVSSGLLADQPKVTCENQGL